MKLADVKLKDYQSYFVDKDAKNADVTFICKLSKSGSKVKEIIFYADSFMISDVVPTGTVLLKKLKSEFSDIDFDSFTFSPKFNQKNYYGRS